MSTFTQIILVIAILVAQHFLSRREQPYWGAILPILYIAFLVYGEMTSLFKPVGEGDKGLIYIGILGTVILLLIWTDGRKVVSMKRQKEMEKLEVQNM